MLEFFTKGGWIMSFIQANELTKTYTVFEKEDGILGSAKGLFVRKYKTVEAVKAISFSVEEGDIVGYIGANGSGKTTTLKMLSGLIRPTAGTLTVGGFIPAQRKTAFKNMFALVMGQKNQLWWDLPAKESFALFGAIYQVDKQTYVKRLNMLVDLLDAGGLLDKPVRNLSLGERMKMEIIGSLLHNPKILFLDEPTIGLDLLSQQKIRQFFKELNKEEHTTIILTSHYMKDIEELCNKLLVIHKGTIVYDGTADDIKGIYSGQRTVCFTYTGELPESELRRYGKVLGLQNGKGKLSVRGKPVVKGKPAVKAEDILSIHRELVDRFSILDFWTEETDMEDAVLRLFSEKS